MPDPLLEPLAPEEASIPIEGLMAHLNNTLLLPDPPVILERDELRILAEYLQECLEVELRPILEAQVRLTVAKIAAWLKRVGATQASWALRAGYWEAGAALKELLEAPPGPAEEQAHN